MLLDQVNSTQRFWLGTTQLNGHIAIRVAIGNLRVEKWHVEALWSELKRRVRE